MRGVITDSSGMHRLYRMATAERSTLYIAFNKRFGCHRAHRNSHFGLLACSAWPILDA